MPPWGAEEYGANGGHIPEEDFGALRRLRIFIVAAIAKFEHDDPVAMSVAAYVMIPLTAFFCAWMISACYQCGRRRATHAMV